MGPPWASHNLPPSEVCKRGDKSQSEFINGNGDVSMLSNCNHHCSMLKHPVLVRSLAVVVTTRVLALNRFGCFPIIFELNHGVFIPNSPFSLHVCEKRPIEKGWRKISVGA